MLGKNSSQSLSISSSQLSGGVQIGQAEGDLLQSQQLNQGVSDVHLTSEDVTNLIDQVTTLIQEANLPSAQKEKVIKHLHSVKEEAQEKEPDKDFATKNLQRAVKTLKEADEAVRVGQGLWDKISPLISKLLPWLGLASNFFI